MVISMILLVEHGTLPTIFQYFNWNLNWKIHKFNRKKWTSTWFEIYIRLGHVLKIYLVISFNLMEIFLETSWKSIKIIIWRKLLKFISHSGQSRIKDGYQNCDDLSVTNVPSWRNLYRDRSHRSFVIYYKT